MIFCHQLLQPFFYIDIIDIKGEKQEKNVPLYLYLFIHSFIYLFSFNFGPPVIP